MSNQLAAGLFSGPSLTEAEPSTTKPIGVEKAIEEVTPATGRLIVIDRAMAGFHGNGPLDSIIVRGKCS